MKRSFHSFLNGSLAAYLDFKAALGFTNYGSATCLSVAKAFDDYLMFRGIDSFERLTEEVVHGWMHSIRRNSAKTKNKYLLFARRFFDHLVRRGVVATNPARRLVQLRETAYRPHIFTLQEIKNLLTSAAAIDNPSSLFPQTLATLYHLLYACALRVGEGMKLRIRDVDFGQNTLSLWRTKFHKERVVPFSEATARRLGVYMARRRQAYPPANDEAPFFVHKGRPLYYVLVHLSFHQCLEAARIPHRVQGGARLHDLRHTAAVHRLYKWYQEGHNPLNKLTLLSTFMGHAAVAHTQVYLTITRDLLREGDRRFQAGFEEIVKKRTLPVIRR
jgi:integrase/recombinase XerD